MCLDVNIDYFLEDQSQMVDFEKIKVSQDFTVVSEEALGHKLREIGSILVLEEELIDFENIETFLPMAG